jgi:malate dehydrogenase (oxaloacetate-decarboxylating)(NADP+)
MATGRSDYPNQVNNVLGFPFIFRGALDVRSTTINEEMKLAAVKALAELAKKQVPDIVNMAYGNVNLKFGRDYIIPKPVDPRLISTVAPAVARAAMESGVAKYPITDWEAYAINLSKRLGHDSTLSKVIESKAKQSLKRVVFADAENIPALKAAHVVFHEGIAMPVLLGTKKRILEMMRELEIDLPEVEIIDPKAPQNEQDEARLIRYSKAFFEKRKRKGVTLQEAEDFMMSRTYFGVMMVELGDADAMIGGLTKKFPYTVRPALQIIGPREDVRKVAGVHIMMTRFGPLFIADTTVNHVLTPEDIADIAELAAEEARRFDVQPRIALVTYSNFGSVPDGEAAVLMRTATGILQKRHPDWMIDGEMQAHLALNPYIRQQSYPFCKLGEERANIIIMPNLSSANVTYNMLHELYQGEIIGPILVGLKKPVHILQLGASVRQIVDMVGLAAVHAQGR